MGGKRDGTRGGLLEVSHRPGAVPASRENVLVEGPQFVQHGWCQPRLCDGHRKAGRSRRVKRGTFMTIVMLIY